MDLYGGRQVQNKCFVSKQCLSFRNTLLFLQNKLHSFQSKCFSSKQMFHFKTNVSFQNKCFISKQMFHFKTNVSFQNKCFISKQMFLFKTNVSFQHQSFIPVSVPVVPVAYVGFVDVFEINSPFIVMHNKCIINETQNNPT